MIKTLPILVISSPCFNESSLIENSGRVLSEVISELIEQKVIHQSSFILFVDDGSTDDTWKLLNKMSHNNPKISGIKLSRNFGHQYALIAGMLSVKDTADYVITIDSDLQDDIGVIEEMVKKANNGAHIVYGIRSDREFDSYLKRVTAEWYYKVLAFFFKDIIYNHGDFRLVSKEILQVLNNYQESNLFLRGILASLGFSKDIVYYERKPRSSGSSKYSLGKMTSLAIEGITSFSTLPLKMTTFIGIVTFIFSIVLSLWALYTYLKEGVVPGWTSIVIPLYFLGGMQMLSMGIVGEYLGKVYKEVKGRPRYIVEKNVGKSISKVFHNKSE